FAATHREREREDRTRADLALHPDLAAVEFHKLPTQGQSHPCALHLLVRRPDLPELLEYRLLVLRRDPDPGVADRHFDRLVNRHRPYFDPAALRCELDRIRQQVQDHLPDLSLVCAKLAEPLIHAHLQCDAPSPRAPAARIRALSSAVGRWKSVSSSSIRPASIFDRSRMSLIRDKRCCPEAWMSFEYSSCFSFSSPNIRSPRTSEKPMMAFSGVRSSCDMLAKNSDLCWLATASSRFAASSSLNRRTFSMAITAWAGEGWRGQGAAGGG